jgi:hypothetical protein
VSSRHVGDPISGPVLAGRPLIKSACHLRP